MAHHPIHKHMHTFVTKKNVHAAIRDDKAHMTYLKEDIDKDQKYGGKFKDINQTADEKHISKLAGDVKHDERKEHISRKSSSPLNQDTPPPEGYDPKKWQKAKDLDEKSFEKDKEGGDGARLRRRAGRVRTRAKNKGTSRKSSSPLNQEEIFDPIGQDPFDPRSGEWGDEDYELRTRDPRSGEGRLPKELPHTRPEIEVPIEITPPPPPPQKVPGGLYPPKGPRTPQSFPEEREMIQGSPREHYATGPDGVTPLKDWITQQNEIRMEEENERMNQEFMDRIARERQAKKMAPHAERNPKRRIN